MNQATLNNFLQINQDPLQYLQRGINMIETNNTLLKSDDVKRGSLPI